MSNQRFKTGEFAGFSVNDAFAQAAIRETPVIFDVGTIQWPDNLGPKPLALGAYTPGQKITDPVTFKADVLILLYTDLETRAFLDVFTGNNAWTPARKQTWNGYGHNFASFQNIIQGIQDNDALKSGIFGYLSAVQIGDQKVAIYKTELHAKVNGNKLAIIPVIQQLVSELGTSLVITTGSAGGNGGVLNCGDVAVTSEARFRVSTEYPTFPKIDSLSNSDVALTNSVQINDKYLAYAAANLTKLTLPMLAQCYGEFQTRAGFKFLRKNTTAPAIYVTDIDPVPGPEPMAIVSADFLSVDDTTNAEGLQALGIMNDNDDAYACFAIDQMTGGNKPKWLSVRNASDPQVMAPPIATGKTPSEIKKQLSAIGGAIFGVYEYVTTINSALACWAIVAGNADSSASSSTSKTSSTKRIGRNTMETRKVFHDSVQELPEQAGTTANGLNITAARADHASEKMPVTFSLAIPDKLRKELEMKVAKGETVSPAELNSKYAVPETEVDPLLNWLKGQEFQVKRVSADRTSVFAQATVAQIEKSLQVQMVRVTKDGLTYTAARNAPSLPADIAGSVHAIGGLQPYRHAQKHFRHGPKQFATSTAVGANTPPYKINEILKAYNADNLDVTGKGQTIAILIDTFPQDKDLQIFWKDCDVATTLRQIQKVNVGSGPLPAPEGEETLDVCWSSGVAPDATIRIYATGSLQFPALDLGLDMIIGDLSTQTGMHQLSISLGLGETFMQPGDVRTQHQRFLRLAAAGVNVFVSSGDAGSNPDSTGHSTGGPLQAEYSSSDPCVIGVGGTSLVLAPDGSVAQETGWSGGGGGKSKLFARPIWQTGKTLPAGTQRLVPDVSLTADPNEGVFLILNGKPIPGMLGGTSWSAPTWAGFCALINEARANAKKPPLPFLNTLIYSLLGTGCFRDIIGGSNGAYDAVKGYDLVTGIGVPIMDQLIANLIK